MLTITLIYLKFMKLIITITVFYKTKKTKKNSIVPFLPYGDVRKGSNWWLKETLSTWLGVDQYVIDILKIDKYELSSNIGQPFSHLASMYASTGIRITYEINLLVDTNVHQNLGTAIAYNLLNNLVQPKNFNSNVFCTTCRRAQKTMCHRKHKISKTIVFTFFVFAESTQVVELHRFRTSPKA